MRDFSICSESQHEGTSSGSDVREGDDGKKICDEKHGELNHSPVQPMEKCHETKADHAPKSAVVRPVPAPIGTAA